MKLRLLIITIGLQLVVSQSRSEAQSQVQQSEAHDTGSQALRTIKPSTKKSKGLTKVHPVKPLNYPRSQHNAAPLHLNPRVLQRRTDHAFGQHVPTTPSVPNNTVPPQSKLLASTVTSEAGEASGFEGLGDNGTPDRHYAVDAAPSDTNGAVGSKQFVEWVNEALIVFNKQTGAVEAGPLLGNEIWKNFARSPNGDLHPCEKDNDGDPIVQYDRVEHRWILAQFAVDEDPNFYECIAVSTSDDATGTYHRYAYKFDKFNDYPKIAVWQDGYYGTFNMFVGNTQISTKACVFDKQAMMAGNPGKMICVDLPINGGVGGLLPADLDGNPPANKTPEFLMNLGFNELQLWTLTTDWDNGTAALNGPVHIPVEPFTAACENHSNGSCIPQPGNAPRLEALGDRLMYRLQFRHFPDHESLVVNHSVEVKTGTNNFVTAVRWYEVRDPQAVKPTLFQQSSYAPDDNFRWMGSVATDKQGNMLVGYSVSNTHTFPSLRFAGRFNTDPLGQLSAEVNAVSGAGSQVAGDRWGDYSSVSLDPDDDCTFWFAAQYQKDGGGPNAFNWHTYIKRVKFPGCK